MMRRLLILLSALVVASLTGCGSSSPLGPRSTSTARSQEEQDHRDNEAVAHQVNAQVEEREKSAATEEAARTGQGLGLSYGAKTVCTKQSSTAYKCLSEFPERPGTPSVVTNVTCGRNGESCITETG